MEKCFKIVTEYNRVPPHIGVSRYETIEDAKAIAERDMKEFGTDHIRAIWIYSVSIYADNSEYYSYQIPPVLVFRQGDE